MIRKSLEIKDVTESGIVMAVFATLNVIDKDGDKTLPGFFGKQDVAMLPAHDWQHVTIGKGSIHESGDKAIAELKMNLDIPSAKDRHSALLFDMKNGSPLQQWSYGFTILPGGCTNGDGKECYRMLQPVPEGGPGCIVHEVSPVLVGAGVDTGTLAVKGVKFADETEATMGAVEALILRAKSLADLRAKEGRGLSTANKERLKALLERLASAGVAMGALTMDDETRATGRVELFRYLRTQAGI